ncbi:MAG TPA: AI-2E family transporter [Bacteroidota bacterium]|nr:AI-2E family transporter [Bacteroidota bacterium]
MAARRRKVERDLPWDSLFASLGRIEVVLLVGGVLLVLVLIYTIQSILSPFLVLGAILFILYPLRRYMLARNVMWLSIILFSLWFLHSISNILAPFIVSLIFAYVMTPAVDALERFRIPRWVSSLVLILLFITGISLILFFVLPVALSQFEGVLDTITHIIADFRNSIGDSNFARLLQRYGVSPEEVKNLVSNQLTPKVEDILKGLLSAIVTLVSSISGLLTQVFYIILVPFLTFYILADFPKISHRFRMLFPRRIRDQVGEYMDQADDLIGRYLRGAITVALLQGIAVSVLFSIFEIKYALLLGLLAALFDLVPYFGLIMLMIVAMIVATFSEPPIVPKVVISLASIWVLHIIELVFLSPRIVGRKVGVHPLLIILSLLVFMYFLGFVGLLIAVPSTALIILFVRDWENRRRSPSLRAVESPTSGV